MIEFIRKPYAETHHTNQCVTCDGQAGPMGWVRGRELRGWGDVYVCAGCWESLGRALGTLEGDAQTEVLGNAKLLAQRDKELATANKRIAKQDEQLKTVSKERDTFAKECEWAVGRVEQLEAALRQDAERLLAEVAAK